MKQIIQDPEEALGDNGVAVIVMMCPCGIMFATDEYSVLSDDSGDVSYIDDCPVCGALNIVRGTEGEDL
jgi:hypothetical protein